ncbi:MAG: NUDIX hydrolase [Thermodesulfobacteriota bacterium]|nr:NUDIX hydrolase [Thermodesulfobacteriota bacterium]
MSLKVQKIKDIYEGRIFNVALEQITLPNGVVKNREVVRHPGAAAMVPLFDDGNVALIKQYRHAVGAFLWEIPAGTLEPNESPLACARRELVEETGFEAKDLVKVAQILPAPGYTDECIHIFLATGLTPAEQDLDEDEILEVQPTPFDRAIEMITEGKIQDAKTITGLLLTARDKGIQG